MIKLQSLIALQEALENEDYKAETKIDTSFHLYIIEKAGSDELVNIWFPYVMRMRINYKRIANTEQCFNNALTMHRALQIALREENITQTIKSTKANIN